MRLLHERRLLSIIKLMFAVAVAVAEELVVLRIQTMRHTDSKDL